MKSLTPIIITAYSDDWQRIFDQEKKLLAEILSDVEIEHIGSTAVKGLAAKPIIDIMIGVNSLEKSSKYISAVTSLGYLYIQEYEKEMPERRYFKKISTDGEHTHHIHLVEKNSTFWERHLYFRDKLRADNKLRDDYAELKYQLAKQFRDDREAYTNAKTNFIMSVEQERLNQLRTSIGTIANRSVQSGNVIGWFEEVYQNANEHSSQIPWADDKANSYLTEWLDKESVVGNGRTALIVGCGLGDDAEELANRGFQVVGFDVSDTAINWTKKRFPKSKVQYQQADLFNPLPEWHHHFDLVYECYTIQALPRNIRNVVIRQITDFVAVEGLLLVVARGWRGEGIENGPPWPITNEEIQEIEIDLQKISFEEFWETETNTRRIRCLYQRV